MCSFQFSSYSIRIVCRSLFFFVRKKGAIGIFGAATSKLVVIVNKHIFLLSSNSIITILALENVSFSTEEYKQNPSDFCIHPSIFCQNTLQFSYFVNDCISTWNAFLLNLHLFNQSKATLNKAYRNLHLYSFVCVFCRTNVYIFFCFSFTFIHLSIDFIKFFVEN